MKVVKSDNEILSSLKKGDAGAFDQVYTLFFKPLCYFAEKICGSSDTAADIVTESFIKLLQKDRDFETLNKLKSFLYTTTRNGCYDLLRTEKIHERIHTEIRYLSPPSEDEIENNIIQAEVLQAIYTAIEELPDKYKGIVKLALVDGKNNEEIMQETGMTYQAVRNHKSEGIKLLRSVFKNSNLSPGMLLYCMVYLWRHI